MRTSMGAGRYCIVLAAAILACFSFSAGNIVRGERLSPKLTQAPDYLYFLAIRVDNTAIVESVTHRQEYIGEQIKKKYTAALHSITPQPPEKLHITLQQIGKRDKATVDAVIGSMWKVVGNKKVTPFNLADSVRQSKFEVWHNGYFVYRLKEDAATKLTALADFVRDTLDAEGVAYDSDRYDYGDDWKGHMSVGTWDTTRVDPKKLRGVFSSPVSPPKSTEFIVHDVLLLRSDQNVMPREYELVKTFPFRTPTSTPNRAPGMSRQAEEPDEEDAPSSSEDDAWLEPE